MSSSSLGNQDVIATTADASQRYQYKAYPRQSDTSTADSTPLSSNLLSGRGSGDGAAGNRVASTRGAVNPEIGDLLSSSGASLSGPSPSATSKRWLVSSGMSRRLREFIPDFRKDQEYWQKRQKNNEAAKRSREKRRINDVVMGKRIYELSSENKRLRLELEAIKRHFGYPLNVPYPIDAATLAASTAPGRPESPMMFGAMSSADSDDDSESSQSKQTGVSSGCSTHGFEYHRQPSTQDSSTPPSSANQISDQRHFASEGVAVDGEKTYLRASNNISGGLDQSTVGYRQPHRHQHYPFDVKYSDAHVLTSSVRHPSQDSSSRYVPRSLDSSATPQAQKTTSTTSKSSAALARAEVLERLAMSRAKLSMEQQMESSDRSSRRYDDTMMMGQYYERRSPSFRSSSDMDSRSEEHSLLHEDLVRGCVSSNRNNGAFISPDLNDESSHAWQLKHRHARSIKVDRSIQSRFNDGELGFSDVSSDTEDARVQFSVAERSTLQEQREGRGLREAPLNLTKRLRMSALHGADGRGVSLTKDKQLSRYIFQAHDEAEMPPLMRTNRAMLSRSSSGDVKTVPNTSPTVSPTCSSAPVPEFFLRSPLQLRSRTDSPPYHSSTSEAQWTNSRGQVPPLDDFAPLSLPNIGTLTPGSRALRFSQRTGESPVAQSLVMSADDYNSEYSDSVNATRRRLKLDEVEDASKSIEVINRHVRGGVPLKVWHKRSSAQASDEWPLLEDSRFDSVSPRLDRHGSTSEVFHSSRESEELQMNYQQESEFGNVKEEI